MKKINHQTLHRLRTSAIILALLVLWIVFSILPVKVYANSTIPDATSQFYVNDFADVFTAEEEAQLVNNAVALADNYDGIQVVVTTIESLGGNAIENYALNMYNKYGIGKDDMGLLILLSTGDREIRVQTGLAMEAYFPDSKVGRFIDNYAIPSLADNKFNVGLINLQEAFIEEIISCVEQEKANGTTDTEINKNSSTDMPGLELVAFIFVIALVVIITITVYKLTTEKEHKSEIASLKKQLENQRQTNLHQEENFNSRIKQAYSKHSSEITSLRQELERTSENYQSLRQELEGTSQNYQSLLQKYNTLQNRYERGKTLHPGIDNEISAMIAEEIRQKDMALAQEVDASITRVLCLKPSKDLVEKFEYLLSHYSLLSESQKSYVTCDISHLNTLYSESKRLRREYEEQQETERRKKCAATALVAITAIISCMSIGKARDLSNLNRAKAIYDNLDSGSRSYFDCNTAEKLETLLSQAKRDKRRIEEEEEAERQRKRQREEEEEAERRRKRQREEEDRRRRSQTYSHRSTSSFSHSSHGGFRGSSGGGGAGRKF